MKDNSFLGEHTFVFNNEDNGGEQVSLCTRLYDDGQGGASYEQELCLDSYSNGASFTLVGAALTPQKLRQLADQLEAFETKVKP